MLNRRFQMLFDKEMWNKVTKIAKSQNVSFGELIRGAIRDYLAKQNELESKEKSTPFKGFFKRKG